MSDTDKITHSYGWQLDKGLRRKRNQDSLAVAKMRHVSEAENHSIGVYIIADGVAGSPDGDVASKLAVDVTMREILANAETMISNGRFDVELRRAARCAHEAITEDQKDNIEPGATTMVVAIVVDTTAYILNVGDSRAYALTDGRLRQITRDHTFVQELVKAGAITEEQAIDHPHRNVLSQAIGGKKDFKADVFVEEFAIGDYLLLCSDGLYNLVAPDTITAIIVESESPQVATQRLTEAANDAGGKDNIAVVVIEIQERSTLE